MKFTDFRPRWMRDLSEEDRRVLGQTPSVGSLVEVAPGLTARLLPFGGAHRLSAKTLSDTILHMQQIVQYAGYDVCHGINPNFADLRSLSDEVKTLTKLTVEPFGAGSFVIPARLETAPQPSQMEESRKPVAAEDVVRRFDEIFELVERQATASQVSIGAIQAVESLGRVLNREVEAIEFMSFDSLGRRRKALPIRVDPDFIGRVAKVKSSRQPTRARLDTLEGTITALDISTGKLQLTLKEQGRRVSGTFDMLFLPSLIESLGQRVKLEGNVQRTGRTVMSIQVLSAEPVFGED